MEQAKRAGGPGACSAEQAACRGGAPTAPAPAACQPRIVRNPPCLLPLASQATCRQSVIVSTRVQAAHHPPWTLGGWARALGTLPPPALPPVISSECCHWARCTHTRSIDSTTHQPCPPSTAPGGKGSGTTGTPDLSACQTYHPRGCGCATAAAGGGSYCGARACRGRRDERREEHKIVRRLGKLPRTLQSGAPTCVGAGSRRAGGGRKRETVRAQQRQQLAASMAELPAAACVPEAES